MVFSVRVASLWIVFVVFMDRQTFAQLTSREGGDCVYTFQVPAGEECPLQAGDEEELRTMEQTLNSLRTQVARLKSLEKY